MSTTLAMKPFVSIAGAGREANDVASTAVADSHCGRRDREVVESRLAGTNGTGRIAHVFDDSTSSVRIANSLLDGGTSGLHASVKCFDDYDENFDAAACTGV